MQYAIINGVRRTAEPKLKAVCGHCQGVVQAKCGSQVVWHWAHIAAESCDSWYEPETQWHRDWKAHFGQECSEISIIKEDIRHIADVLTKNNLVIEFQNSPISAETIREREVFYDKMIWVINGKEFKDNFHTEDKEFAEKWMPAHQTEYDIYLSPKRPKATVLQIKETQIKQPGVGDILLSLKFIHHSKNEAYYYDLTDLYDQKAIVDRLRAKILKLYRENRPVEKLKAIIYQWGRPRKSWAEAQKPVFIDFNEDYLVWIKSNLGNRTGEGLKVSKKDFLAKYAG